MKGVSLVNCLLVLTLLTPTGVQDILDQKTLVPRLGVRML